MVVAENTSKERAADQLVATFEAQILSGQLAAGSPLPPEREIVQGHGVSRTVVREAVRMLASKGLITARRGFRPVVAEPGYDTAFRAVESIVARLVNQTGGVWSLFELRIRMEVSLARDAARSASSQHIQRLEEALSQNKAAIPNSTRFYETDIAFHRILYEIPGNPALPTIHRAYTEWLSQHWLKMPRVPSRNEINYNAHKAIFDAILRRDPDKSELATRDHLDFAWKQVSSTFNTSA
ncbi:MAG: FCD domain-containing protein [Pseudomonadota bacterium]